MHVSSLSLENMSRITDEGPLLPLSLKENTKNKAVVHYEAAGQSKNSKKTGKLTKNKHEVENRNCSATCMGLKHEADLSRRGMRSCSGRRNYGSITKFTP